MDENKWNAFFKYGKGTGFYFMILFPYLVMLVVLFLISKSWFDFIDFEHSVLGSLSVVLFLSLFVVFAFPKLKRLVDDKVKESNRAAS
ncbi:hypothetical protein [Sporosarcina gallistercoris]|uniref:Uncharacterized protein n=1 Tax=Sporosarcina gallistercoris TaxID=2762245 RepID=A0ABR8PI98_9BACL|nr:hypothetical protein [Sporosarcina gallistercoris]MBD7907879.1 hypothetical protein [Sporosarcina gallistercoris]